MGRLHWINNQKFLVDWYSFEGWQASVQYRTRLWEHLLDKVGKVIQLETSDQICDIGGGIGNIFLALDHCSEKYVVDPLLNYAFTERPELRDLEKFKCVPFLSKPIEDCNFKHNFDVVFCLEALDHVDDLTRFVGKVRGMLSDGKYLVLFVQCYLSELAKEISNTLDPEHTHSFTLNDIESLFRSQGFTLESSQSFENPKPVRVVKAFQMDRRINRNPHLAIKLLLWKLTTAIATFLQTGRMSMNKVKEYRIFIFQRRSLLS